MEFNVSCPDTSALREIGVGACVFVSGGIASYIFYRYMPTQSCESTALGSPELVKQVIGLKDEIKYLKCKLASALTDVGRGMDDIRASQFRLSQMHIGQIASPPSGRPHSAYSQDPVPQPSVVQALVAQTPAVKSSIHQASQGRPSLTEAEPQAPPSMQSLKSRKSSFTTDDDDDYQSVKESLTDCASYAPEAIRGILAEVDKLNMGSDEDRERAMKLLHDYEVSYPNSAQIKWRLARAHLWRYGDSERPELKRMHANAALRCAEEALRMNIQSPDVHKWYAVSLATSLDFKSPAEKMQKNNEILKHLEKSIELDPLEPMPYYIKGKWCWGVYKLRWIEKKLTNAMYGVPPSVSFEEIVESFLKAEDLAPGFYKANRLYLAKCYLEKEDYETSKDWLLAAHTLPIRNREDRVTQSIIEELLKEMRIKVDWF